jgi:hypothetical protein
MADLDNQYYLIRIANLIENPIVPDSDPIAIVRSGKLRGARTTGVSRQTIDAPGDPFPNFLLQFPQFARSGGGKLDSTNHDFNVARVHEQLLTALYTQMWITPFSAFRTRKFSAESAIYQLARGE